LAFASDAKGAKLVLNAGFEFTMVPLNVTHQVHMNKEFRSALCSLGVIGTTRTARTARTHDTHR
jgi:inosine-uridine nucleoside N-ribohydrolase